MFRCTDIFDQSAKLVPKSGFCPQPVRGKCPGEFRPNFLHNSHKWICVQLWLRSVQWPKRLGVEKEEGKNTVVKYKPFSIAMPCGLIIIIVIIIGSISLFTVLSIMIIAITRVHTVHLMNTEWLCARWPPTIRPRQQTGLWDRPFATAFHTHYRHLLLLPSPKYNTHFTVINVLYHSLFSFRVFLWYIAILVLLQTIVNAMDTRWPIGLRTLDIAGRSSWTRLSDVTFT